jgi:predicted AlkP superfamily phosphohydrolase/phosphomutase
MEAETTSGRTPPLVILGMDVGDADLVERWAGEGYLPTIASVMRRGWWARTGGPELVSQYGTGLTLSSGISRSDHGYYYFRQLKPGTYDLCSSEPSDASAPPFWWHLRGRDKKVFVVDPPETDPVPGLPGLQLADWAIQHAVHDPTSEPPGLIDEVRSLVGEHMRIPPVPDADFHEDRAIYDRCHERLEKKARLCRHYLSTDRFDLVSVTFAETEPASHQCWKYRPEARRRGDAPTVLGNGIRDIYQATDRAMGSLLEFLPSDANVVIYSLFGMQDEHPPGTLTEAFCRRLGYHVSRPPSQRPLSALSLARRVIPSRVRLAVSHRLPASTQDSLLGDELRIGTDWDRTTAFAIPSLFSGFVRVNLRGREPRGIVEPGAQYEAVLDQLEADLAQLVDPRDGLPAVKGVARTVDIFHCDAPASLPDLFVEWKPSAHLMDRVLHPRAELVQERPQYCPESEERLAGFVTAAGPSIQAAGDIGEVSLLQLAPTWLSLMGEPVPQTMSGEIIEPSLARR